MAQRRREVVRPAQHQRVHDDGQVHARDGARHQGTVGEGAPVGGGTARGGERPGRGGDQRVAPALHHPVHQEGQHRRDQQHHRHGGPHREVLLTRDLVVDLGGHHRELAPDGLGGAEVGEDEREHHEAGAHEPELHPRQGHGEEGAERARAECPRRVVEAGVGRGERGHQDEQRVGEAVEDLGHHDALGPVDADVPAGGPGHDAVVAEDVDERERLHQRGSEQRQHRHQPEDAAPGHAGAGERVGVGEGQRHRDRHGHDGDEQAVGDGLRDGGRAEVAAVVRNAHEGAVVGEQAPPDHLQERVEHEEVQDRREPHHERPAHEVLAAEPAAHGAVGQRGRVRERGGHVASPRRGRRAGPRAGARAPARSPRPRPAPRRRWRPRRSRAWARRPRASGSIG